MLYWLDDNLFERAASANKVDDSVAHFDRLEGASWFGDSSKEKRASSRGWSVAGADDMYVDGSSMVAYHQRTDAGGSQK